MLIAASVGWNPAYVGRARISAGADSQAGYTLLSGAPVVVEDLANETRFKGGPVLHGHEVASGISVIVGAQQHPFGILAVHSKRRRQFRQDEVFFLEAIAGLLGSTIERSRAERAAQEHEQWFRLLIENASDLVSVVSVDGTIKYASPSHERILGYRPEELEGKNVFDLTHPDDRAEPWNVFTRERGAFGELHCIELRYRHKDGSWRVLEGVIKNLINNPAVGGVLVNARDITERKRAEETIRQREEYFRSLIENGLDMIAVVAADGTIQYQSPSSQVLGYLPNDVIGTSIFDFVHPDDAESARLAYESIRGGGLAYFFSCRVRHRDGSWRTIEATAHNLLGHAAVQGIVINSRDITERKQAEDTLCAMQERLRHVVSSSQVVIYSLEIHGDELVPTWVSDNITRIMGYEPKSALSMQWWADRIHPDDRGQVVQNSATLLAKGHLTHEYRLQDNAGEYHWVRDELRVLHDAEGRPVEVVGACSDITERQRALAVLWHRMEFESLITTIATKFINLAPEEVDREIHNTLEAIGGFSGVDWIYTLLVSRDRPTLRKHHEWCAPGISSLIDQLKDVAAGRFPWAEKLLGDFTSIKIFQTSEFPLAASAEKAFLESLGVRSTLLAPLTAGGMLVGLLGFTSMRREKHWSDDDVTLLAIVCEILVNALQRKRAQVELRRSQEQLRALSARLLSVQERERARIAREAHDELGQSLTALRFDLVALSKKLSARQAALRQKTQAMVKLVDTTLSSVRRIATELRPWMLDDLGLVAAIEWQLQEFEARTGIATALSTAPGQLSLDRDRSTTVFRIVQEALTNVARHAQATAVQVALRQDTYSVSLDVCDNGRGIPKEKIRDGRSLGLIGIRERLLPFDGRVEITGSAGQGTHVAVYMPMPDSSPRAESGGT